MCKGWRADIDRVELLGVDHCFMAIVGPGADPRRGGFGAIELWVGDTNNRDIIEREQIADMPTCDPASPDESDSRFHAETPGDCTP
jgi:hypothetical protein